MGVGASGSCSGRYAPPSWLGELDMTNDACRSCILCCVLQLLVHTAYTLVFVNIMLLGTACLLPSNPMPTGQQNSLLCSLWALLLLVTSSKAELVHRR